MVRVCNRSWRIGGLTGKSYLPAPTRLSRLSMAQRRAVMNNKALIAAIAAVALGAASPSFATTISIDNVNAPGVGFNDTTPATPVAGNAGTTLGQQRLIVFQQAASTWAALLNSGVDIKVRAQ